MDSKQKKIILWTIFVLAVIISIVGGAMWIYGFVSKDQVAHIFGIITSWISPSLLIGIAAKYFMNLHHKKQINEIMIAKGLKEPATVKIKPQTIKINALPTATINGFEFYWDFENQLLVIKMPEWMGTKADFVETFTQALLNFKEDLRKDIIK